MSVIAQAGAKGRQLHKFGGSSLHYVKCYLRVAGIMAEYSQPDYMMVVSAAGSTTNQLINWLKLSQTDRLSAHQVQQTLRRYQCDLISGLHMMVVSAAGSTTNQLINWLKLSQTDRLSAHQVQQTLRRYQCDLISGLLPAEEADSLISAFVSDLERLAALLDSGINDAVYAEVVGTLSAWRRCSTAVLTTQCMRKWWGTVKCGRHA